MQDLVSLPAVVACGALAMTLFAVIRRVLRTDHPPAVFSSDAVAYTAALILTALIALSLMATASMLAPYTGSIVYAGPAAAGLHLVYWMIARIIIPVGSTAGNTTLLPPATPAA